MLREIHQSDDDESQLSALIQQTSRAVNRSFPDSSGFTREERICMGTILLPPVQGEKTAFDGLEKMKIDVVAVMQSVRSKLGLHEDASLNTVTKKVREIVDGDAENS